MPYDAEEDRQRSSVPFESLCATVSCDPKAAAGQVTRIVTKIILRFFNGSYWTRALGFGCLLCAILEVYRRRDVPKERDAIRRNGDLPEFEGYDV